MSGKFIAIEGLDGAGKTTLIANLKPKMARTVFLSGFPIYHNLISKVIFHLPSWGCYLDFLFQTYFCIWPRLLLGQTVVTDRYYYSVDTFFPDCTFPHNRFLSRVFRPLFFKPDLYVFITVSPEERMRRLKKRPERSDWRIEEDPTLSRHRNKNYEDIFKGLTTKKLLIDTTSISIEDNVQKIFDAIQEAKNES